MRAARRSPRLQHALVPFWLGLVAWAGMGGGGGCTTPPASPHEAAGFQTFTSPQASPIILSPDGDFVYVANTTSNTVAFIRTSDFAGTRNVQVGLEPVSLAARPDGLELWVSNHVSDSVSVIDTDPASASYGQVIETIQSLDANGATEFDEPVGIAFASSSKAYVALSSRNRIAVVDAANYAVTGFLSITAQEPRAITVRNGKLYVAAFESGNRTQLSACGSPPPNPTPSSTCSLGPSELIAFATQPNLPGEVKNIVTLPAAIPDRDVFVFDTATDALVSTATSVGTLLYGIAVAGNGTIFVSQTDARNLVNGGHGDVLASLGGRMFDNEVAKVTCGGASCTTAPTNLEPGGTTHANSLATPYGLALSGNDATLLVTAAGASRLASFDAASMALLDVLDVGAIPKGVAFDAPGSASGTAYVLNTLGNSVSKVSVAPDGTLALVATRNVGNDPTPPKIRNGNIAFNNAFASTTGSHSCGSCHPDGNTDQLLWRIGGACDASIGCDPGDEPRTTMPIRGLRNTVPLHWDGTLGDPFGGGNGAVGVAGAGGTSCTLGDLDGDRDCFLNLVEASLTGVMCDQSGPCPDTALTAVQQEDMAIFLANVSYPPARSRRLDDTLSDASSTADLNGIATSARQGFADFFTDVGGNGGGTRTCADANGGCHALPLGASTNSATLNGFDAPTMRGLTDRFLQFSLGPTAAAGIQSLANVGGLLGSSPLEPEIAWNPALGFQEVTVFGAAFGIFEPVYGMRPPDLFQMFEEASTGYSGALGRQVTLNTATASQPGVQALLGALEDADARGVVNLRGRALRDGAGVDLSYDAPNDRYLLTGGTTVVQSALLAEAQAGSTLATLTAYLRAGASNAIQPLLSTTGTVGNGLIGDPPLPQLATNHPAFNVAGIGVASAATVVVDGQPAAATLTCSAGSANGFCNNGTVSIDLASRPTPDGLHLLQVLNPSGLLSNELPICVAPNTSLSLCISD
jgi:YVTN family beta-propeller protein